MTRYAAIVICVVGMVAHTSAQDDQLVSLNFSNAPLHHLVDFYEDLTGQAVTVEEAYYPEILLQSEGRWTKSETIAALENYCASNGIRIAKTDSGVVITPDVAKMPEDVKRTPYEAFGKRPRRNVSPRHTMTNGVTSRQMSEDEWRQLHEYQLQVIRAGLPPLPLSATTNGSREDGK